MFLPAVLHPDVVDFLRADRESDLKESVWKCIEKLRQRQFDSGLRGKKLKGTAKRIWEARVTKAIRLIFTYNKSRKPETGEAQVYIAVQDICLEHDDVSRIAKVRKRTPDAEWLDAEEIEAVGSTLDPSAKLSHAERAAIDAAQDEELQVPSDFVDELLGNIQWRVVESEVEWQRAIVQGNADLPLKLTSEEYQLAKQYGNLLLSGSAGTGKTTVALYKLLQSLEYLPSGKRLYIAYNPLLVKNAREQFQQLISNSDAAIVTTFQFKTIRDLCLEILENLGRSYIAENEVNLQVFDRIYRRNERKNYPPALLWDEIRSIIKGAQLSTDADVLSAKDYEKLGRKRSTVIPQGQRGEVYGLATWYQKKLKQDGRFDEIDLARKVLKSIKNAPSFRYQLIVCDEVQDFTELQLELLFQLIAPHGQLFFAGDLHQMISPSGFRWEELKQKFDKTKRRVAEKTLNFNFRSVGTLVNLANQILRLRYRLLGGQVKETSQPAGSYGELGRLITATPAMLKLTLGELNPGEAILVRTDTDKERLRNDFKTTFVFTIQEAKGLEFDTVFLVEFFQHQQELWNKVITGGLRQEKEKPSLQLELNLLYVAITRARRILNIWESKVFKLWQQPELAGCVMPLASELVRSDRVEPTPESWREQGLYYLKAEFYQQAVECFEKSGHTLLQQKALALLLLQQWEYDKSAEIFAELHEWREAARLFEKVCLWQRAANCWASAGNTEKQWICEARALESAELWAEAAQRWKNLRQFEVAAKLFEKVLQWQEAADCWAQAGNAEKQKNCTAYSLETAKQWKEAAQVWESIKRLEDAKRCWFELATTLETAGEWENAAQQWEVLGQCEDAKRCWLSSSNEQKKAQYRALELENQGQFNEAAEQYERAGLIEKSETLRVKASGIPRNLSDLYSELSLEQGMRYLARSISSYNIATYSQEMGAWMESTSYMARENQAVTLKREGNFEGAMTIYEELFADKPHFPRIHYSTFKTLAAANRLNEAYRAIQLWCLAVLSNPHLPIYTTVVHTPAHYELMSHECSSLEYLYLWVEQDNTAMYHLGTMNLILSGTLSTYSTRAYLQSLAGRNSTIQHDPLQATERGRWVAHNLPWGAIADEIADSDIWDLILQATATIAPV